MNASFHSRRNQRRSILHVCLLMLVGLLFTEAQATPGRKGSEIERSVQLTWPAAKVCGHFIRVYVPAAVGNQVTKWVDQQGRVMFKAVQTDSKKMDLDEDTLRAQSTFLRSSDGPRTVNLALGCEASELHFSCDLLTRTCEWNVQRTPKNPLTPEITAAETAALTILEKPAAWTENDPALAAAALTMVRSAADAIALACTGDVCTSSTEKDIAALRALRPDSLRAPKIDREGRGSIEFKYGARSSLKVSCRRLQDNRECSLRLDDPQFEFEDDAHPNSHDHRLYGPQLRWQVWLFAHHLDAPTAITRVWGTLVRPINF